MLKISTNISGLKELQKELDRVENILNMKRDNKFNQFLKDKFMETARRITDWKLSGGTTNDMAIEKYKSSHHIVDSENGFILYNDCVIDANTSNPSDYPNGFSIALAFEYGVGIVGQGTYNTGEEVEKEYFTPWDYNINKYNFGWVFKNEEGNLQSTYGYMGFEIYRYIADEIEKNLVKWYDEYYRKVV